MVFVMNSEDYMYRRGALVKSRKVASICFQTFQSEWSPSCPRCLVDDPLMMSPLSLSSRSTEWQRRSTTASTSGTRAGWPTTWRPRPSARCRTGWWARRRRTWSPARPPACPPRWKGKRSTDTRFITAVAKPRPHRRGLRRAGRAVHTLTHTLTHTHTHTGKCMDLQDIYTLNTHMNSCIHTSPQHVRSLTSTHGWRNYQKHRVNEWEEKWCGEMDQHTDSAVIISGSRTLPPVDGPRRTRQHKRRWSFLLLLTPPGGTQQQQQAMGLMDRDGRSGEKFWVLRSWHLFSEMWMSVYFCLFFPFFKSSVVFSF